MREITTCASIRNDQLSRPLINVAFTRSDTKVPNHLQPQHPLPGAAFMVATLTASRRPHVATPAWRGGIKSSSFLIDGEAVITRDDGTPGIVAAGAEPLTEAASRMLANF